MDPLVSSACCWAIAPVGQLTDIGTAAARLVPGCVWRESRPLPVLATLRDQTSGLTHSTLQSKRWECVYWALAAF